MLCYKTINLKTKPLRVTNLSVNELIQQLSKKLEPLFSTADQPIIVGIETGGYLIAESLYKNLQPETELGKLNITFYRDDFTKTGLHPTVKPSSLPTNIDGKTIILVDDVLYSGRTVRAAMNELFDFGRPDKILLAILIDRGGRELPIQADFVAQTIELEDNEQIKLEGSESLSLSIYKNNSAL
ncbi:MAG: bifunctional pyr operon transcriptional regulator/uracil phosphoribosyltransferase PyrR [Gammaproteobacteria bacterium]|jgi:pyrimidine operon attenuation protein/uracil phosphoribosyltransferase|nr:bifunctional pyr operon transcriptional regulator/uracil phosphoribosyltransferase PyrR [Gammaproteobacteria bacterium]MBT3725472.1 bifunctional pyr operon transcriptional regulator/uracil phosphoribosyltransferase PyrR [Gammaproteobacteria bacterium]MBT4076654.1 bifunctional pyr operon transcriptional regulator/uracil phosphoribosyltransferase PyrR [Gammaproteobacteria bacterium]MBT4195585.1 bifunctional pyr operon transcriptional regulator/uracil phosphoribosyltransferase PyrR [Gammaproteob